MTKITAKEGTAAADLMTNSNIKAAAVYKSIILFKLGEDDKLQQLHSKPLILEITHDFSEICFKFFEDKKTILFKYSIRVNNDGDSQQQLEFAKFGSDKVLVNVDTDASVCLQFADQSAKHHERTRFLEHMRRLPTLTKSLFDQRTEESSASQYFQFYGYLAQQQNMMQDYIRTSTYQKAILDNSSDFAGKVVLDVGAGTGILSFFAVQAGAAKVYAIEASSMAQHAALLVKENKMEDKIKVISGKIEEVKLPENVDVIISEPMGYMLLNERMLESFLHAKKWLKPGGKMFPSQGDLYVAPFQDESLYMEQVNKANFWTQTYFYGVDLTSLKSAAFDEYFKQPVVDTFDSRICLAKPVKHAIDFMVADETDLYEIDIPLKFDVQASSIVHGLAFWFEVIFTGSTSQVWLSTSPTQPLTHWYQVRCLFPQPFLVTRATTLIGNVVLKSNKKQSYDIHMTMTVDGSAHVFKNTLDLKNPYFRYNGSALVPPGNHNESPTEQFWTTNPVANNGNGTSDVHPDTVHLYSTNNVTASVAPSSSSSSAVPPVPAPYQHHHFTSPVVAAPSAQPNNFYQHHHASPPHHQGIAATANGNQNIHPHSHHHAHQHHHQPQPSSTAATTKQHHYHHLNHHKSKATKLQASK